MNLILRLSEIIPLSEVNPDSYLSTKSYLRREIKYPKQALQSGVSGTVVVQFQVDSLGNVVNIQVVKSVYPDLDKEVVRAVKHSDKWSPERMPYRKGPSLEMMALASFVIKNDSAGVSLRFWRPNIDREIQERFWRKCDEETEGDWQRNQEEMRRKALHDSVECALM